MQQDPQHLRDAVQPGLQALVQCLAADASICECHQQGACQLAAASAQPRLGHGCGWSAMYTIQWVWVAVHGRKSHACLPLGRGTVPPRPAHPAAPAPASAHWSLATPGCAERAGPGTRQCVISGHEAHWASPLPWGLTLLCVHANRCSAIATTLRSVQRGRLHGAWLLVVTCAMTHDSLTKGT